MDQLSPITDDMLRLFREGFDARPDLGVMANVMTRTHLDDAAFVPSGAAKLRMDFSVTVPTHGVTNQKSSGRCWMFSVMNLLRERIITKLNVDDFALSGVYLAFWDKLEKCNNFLNAIVHYANQELDDRETWSLMGNPIPDGGQFDMALGLIRKYGAVPEWVMPETINAVETAQYLPILDRKLREFGLELREMARAGKDVSARRTEMLQEMYNALRILYGEPPAVFDLEYTDKDKVYHCDPALTPKAFAEKYIVDDFDDYAVLIHTPIHPLNKTYSQPFMGDLVENSALWLNVTAEELKDITIRQLQQGECVCFSCDCHPDRDRSRGWWDPDTFQYGQVLGGLTFGMDLKERFLTRESNMNHCMMFCGVNIAPDGKPNRWKIENSWGDASGQKGYFIGSDKWFDQNVYQVLVRRKLLSEKQKKLFEQEPVPMKLWDPMA